MTPWLDDGDVRLYLGDALEVLRELPDGSVDCVVTSPPYWGLRDYGAEGQIGLEATPDLFVQNMVAVFREVRRVLADHGTCWVNLGDSYAANRSYQVRDTISAKAHDFGDSNAMSVPDGLKPKDLVGIPWRVAFALQADGWWLRSDIVWAKPNPMPESVTDRPTKAHEYVFLLTKQPRYWFDTEAVREPVSPHSEFGRNSREQQGTPTPYGRENGKAVGLGGGSRGDPSGRNVRSVWNIATQPYPEAHFATFPEELARRCILAGCPVRVCRVCGKPSERIVERGEPTKSGRAVSVRVTDSAHSSGARIQPRQRGHNGTPTTETVGWSDCGCHDDLCGWHDEGPCSCSKWRPGTVLDPFIGSGTVAKVARDHQRHAIGIDLNATYLELAARRLQQLSLLNETVA